MAKYLSLPILLLFIFSCSSTKNSDTKTNFYKEQTTLIMKEDSLTPMRIFKITKKTDSILLRTKSETIIANPNDSILKTFVKRLYSTVRDSISMGVGIAAPQVGILKNIIWVQRFDKEGFPFEVYLNPKITEYSKKKQQCREGCLSIPNRTDTLNSRAYSIKIEYDQMNASHKTEMVEGFTAVIFQHEIDHLNGILYLDYLEEEVKE